MVWSLPYYSSCLRVRPLSVDDCYPPIFLYFRYLATTHFEPTYARSAFPCFDEPQFKARFKMSIFRDRFHISLFNMPITSTDDVGFYMGTGLVSGDSS